MTYTSIRSPHLLLLLFSKTRSSGSSPQVVHVFGTELTYASTRSYRWFGWVTTSLASSALTVYTIPNLALMNSKEVTLNLINHVLETRCELGLSWIQVTLLNSLSNLLSSLGIHLHHDDVSTNEFMYRRMRYGEIIIDDVIMACLKTLSLY
jgi:hypothetical protein